MGGRVFHDLAADGAATYDFTLQSSDTVTALTIDPFAAPAGWSGSYKAGFYGAGGSHVPTGDLGVGSEAEGDFYTVPGARAGDLYAVTIDASDGSGFGLGTLYLMDATQVSDLTPELSMQPFPSTYSVAAAAFPTFALDHPDHPDAYMVLTSWPFTTWHHLVTAEWLGNRNAFTVPDLTGIWGFEDLAPASGERVGWFVVAFSSSEPMGRFLASLHYFQDNVIPVPRPAGMRLDSAMVQGGFDLP